VLDGRVNARWNNLKLGRGRITKIARSEFADSMSFVPRNLVP